MLCRCNHHGHRRATKSNKRESIYNNYAAVSAPTTIPAHISVILASALLNEGEKIALYISLYKSMMRPSF
jgi:hypothetical protein